MRILVVEDDPGIAAGLLYNLRHNGDAVNVCDSIANAWAALTHEPFDLMLLDLSLTDGNGIFLLRRLRQSQPASDPLPEPGMPVIIITARDGLADRVDGLDQGADDYLVKPFQLKELQARVRAALRRSSGRASPLMRRGDLVLDPAARTVRRQGCPVELSQLDFALLELLLESPGRVQTRDQLRARLYSWQGSIESNALEVRVHHLRRKLGEELIVTVRGVGYFIPRLDT